MWGPLDDVVMGGVSESGFEVVSGAGEDSQPAGIFSGLVSSSNNGGFASVSPACFLKHLHNVETRFYCPQTFLYLDFQCRDGVSEFK